MLHRSHSDWRFQKTWLLKAAAIRAIPSGMLRRLLILATLCVSAPSEAQRQSIAITGTWGAFAEKGRCFAISEPARAPGAGKGHAFASVGWFPERAVRGQVHIRFAEPKRAGSAVLLRIDGRTFQLVGGGSNAWAPDARADAEIVAAMRSGVEMIVETRNARGGLLRDGYRLRGAATALDAAAIACAAKR
ncbi:MAG TPA: hypothetical protein VIA98_03755 [Allosphingosinicella sp.]